MKKVTIFLILLTILFFAGTSHAYNVSNHDITIKIDADGNTLVEERFYFAFIDEADKSALRTKSIDYGSDLDKWKIIDSRFEPHIGKKYASSIKLSYSEGEQTFLELSYSLKEPLMAKIKETSRKIEFELKATFLDVDYFYGSGLWVIPEYTRVIFELPPNSEITETIEPNATISSKGTRQVVTWKGYKSANKIQFRYAVWTQIAATVDLSKVVDYFLKTEEGQIILGVLAILVAIIFIKRKFIVEKIENFVVKNSKIYD